MSRRHPPALFGEDTVALPRLRPDRLRIVPLGGVGEFGKNMMTMEYGGDMIIVDCGQMFPEADMFGVDSVIPDFSYVADRVKSLRGLILTHGHEDHIGAVPYFLRDFDCPVYGSRLTMEFVRAKVEEMNLGHDPEFHEIRARQKIKLGAFEIEFLQVTHSIPETMALAITLPIGTIVHTGDYKFDTSEDETSDFFTLSRYGESGVLALLGDSTNVDREGHSPTEKSVREGLIPLIATAPAGVILATFASGLHRVQTAMNVAQLLDRKVFLAGRSMERNFAIATKLGLIHYPEGLVLPLREINRTPPKRRLLLSTGSQGEPDSALARLALDSHKGYKIEPNDTVIISARMIPGNEKGIYRMINHLYRRGARVITEKDAPIHASGHAYREEMRALYRMLKPQFLIPIHGELRNLIGQRELAMSLAMSEDDIFIMENGDAIDLGSESAEHYRAKLAGQVLVDGKVMDQLDEVVLRDRKHLSEDGMVIVILAIDLQSHKIIAGPDIVTRGFIEVDSNEKLIAECKKVVANAFEDCGVESREDYEVVKDAVRKALRRFLRLETDRYPIILPVVMEI